MTKRDILNKYNVTCTGSNLDNELSKEEEKEFEYIVKNLCHNFIDLYIGEEEHFI